MLPLVLSFGSYDARGMAAPPVLSTQIDWENTGWTTTGFAGMLALASAVPSVPAIDVVHPLGGQGEQMTWSKGRSGDYAQDASGSLAFEMDNSDGAYTPDRNWCDASSFEGMGLQGWTLDTWTGYTNVAALISKIIGDAAPSAGSNCLEANLTGAADAAFIFSFPSSYIFRAGVSYGFSFYARQPTGAGNFQWGIGSKATATDRATAANQALTGSWALKTLTWTPTADRTDVVLWFAGYGAVTATLRIDAVQVNPGALLPFLGAPSKGMLAPGAAVLVQAAWGSGTASRFFGRVERITPIPGTQKVAVSAQEVLTAYDRKNIATQLAFQGTQREMRLDILRRSAGGWRNEIWNGRFSANTNGWTNSGLTSLTRITGDGPASVGTTCAEAVSPAGTGLAVFTANQFDQPTGIPAWVSVWARSVSGLTIIQINLTSSSNSLSRTLNVTLTPTWQRFTMPYVAPANQSSLLIRLATLGAMTFRFTGVQLTIGDDAHSYADRTDANLTAAPFNYIANPSFELWTASWAGGVPNLVGSLANANPNPSFETGTAGWSTASLSVRSTVPGSGLIPAGGTLTQNRADAAPNAGASCATLLTGATGGGASFALPGTFRSGVKYIASMYVKNATTGVHTPQLLFGSFSVDDGADVVNMTTSGSWTRYSSTWTPTADRTDGAVAITGVAATADMLMDAVQVTQSTTLVGYYDNDIVEAATSATRIATDGQSGSACLQVVTTAVLGSGVTQQRGTILYRAGQPYTLSAWVKSVSGNPIISLGVGSLQAAVADRASSVATVGPVWTRLVTTWVPTADRTDVSVWIANALNGQIGTWNLDAIQLNEGSIVWDYEPAWSSVDIENDAVPSAQLSGTIRASLNAINAVNQTHHYVLARPTSPFFRYVSSARTTLAARISTETYNDDVAMIVGTELDASTIVNTQRVQAGGWYLDRVAMSAQPVVVNQGSGGIVSGDEASILAYGRHDGSAIGPSDLIENLQNDPTVPQAIGDYLVARYRQPKARPRITVINRFPSQLVRELDDLVALTILRLNYSGAKYVILREDTTVSEAGQQWQTVYTVEEWPY